MWSYFNNWFLFFRYTSKEDDKIATAIWHRRQAFIYSSKYLRNVSMKLLYLTVFVLFWRRKKTYLNQFQKYILAHNILYWYWHVYRQKLLAKVIFGWRAFVLDEKSKRVIIIFLISLAHLSRRLKSGITITICMSSKFYMFNIS